MRGSKQIFQSLSLLYFLMFENSSFFLSEKRLIIYQIGLFSYIYYKYNITPKVDYFSGLVLQTLLYKLNYIIN